MNDFGEASGDHPEIREEVRKLRARFPDEYRRKLDVDRGYPLALW